jgi:hypothetical protein
MWLLELASAWVRLGAECGARALAESEPLRTTALAMLPPQCPIVAHACRVFKARSNIEHTTRFLNGMPWLAIHFGFATTVYVKLQADISERVNLTRFANIVLKFTNLAQPESRRFASRLSRGALAFFASDPPTTGRLGELRGKFLEHYDAVFRVVVCRTCRILSPRILSPHCSPIAFTSCHFSVQAMRGAPESACICGQFG